MTGRPRHNAGSRRSRRDRSGVRASSKALTTEEPTPWRPPETLVPAAVAELAAGVQDSQHHFGRGATLLLHDVDRNAAAVVGDRAAVVGMEVDLDRPRCARLGLVDRVVDDLVNQVMETPGSGRADVHTRALADRLRGPRGRWMSWPL